MTGHAPHGGGEPPHVVFDIGNVLIEWDPRHLYRTIFADDAEIDAFLAEVGLFDWNREFDRGRLFADGVAELTARHPAYAEAIEAFDSRWQETVPGEIAANVAILRSLKANGEVVFGITNFSREKFDETRARFPFLDLIDGVVVSADERLLKPDPAIYRLLCDRYGLAAADCIFIDDTLHNVEAARDIGMRAIHLTPGFDLAPALREMGVRL
jgi:2-haloacid dehalogenase